MLAKNILDRLQSEFKDLAFEFSDEPNFDPFINVLNPERLEDIMLFLREEDDMMFDYLANLTGVDYKDSLGVVYHLYSLKHKHRIVLKVKLDRDTPSLPTIERVWKTANWHEREAYDLFGIVFVGHPNMIRILLPYDWEGWPLRKDYKAPEEYNGITAKM